MSRARVEIQGAEDVSRRIRNYNEAAKGEIVNAINATAQAIRSNAVKSIQRSPASGRVYVRGAGGNLSGTHQASSPGNPPRTDTGTLASSIMAEVANTRNMTARVGVESTVEYGFYQEFGTLHMEARPFLEPARHAESRRHQQRIEAALKRAEPK